MAWAHLSGRSSTTATHKAHNQIVAFTVASSLVHFNGAKILYENRKYYSELVAALVLAAVPVVYITTTS